MQYVDQILGESQRDVHFDFVGGAVQRFDHDVIHSLSQDVERLVGSTRLRDARRAVSALSFAIQLKRHDVALVQTVPDTDVRRTTSAAHRILNWATSAWVITDPSTPTPSPKRTVVIPQPHFRDRLQGYPRGPQIAGRILYGKRNGDSKSAIRLAGMMRAVRTSGLSLRIVGEHPQAVTTAVRAAAISRGTRISTRFEKLSDGALALEIDAAELVIIPSTLAFGEQQLALLALSRDRPILVPDNDMNRRLADEAGAGWVHLYKGAATAAALDTAFASLRDSPPPARPNLDERDPQRISDAYVNLYRKLATNPSRHVERPGR